MNWKSLFVPKRSWLRLGGLLAAMTAVSSRDPTKRVATPLLHILDFRRFGAERFLRQGRAHELIEVAVEDAACVGRLHAGAQVLHHLIGLEHIGADLVAPAD